MRTFHERLFSSLITRLTLAVLAVLLFSLGLTTAAFVAKSQADDQAAAKQLLQQKLPLAHKHITDSILNPVAGRPPLARVDPSTLGLSRVLLTSWPNDLVIADTAAGGGEPSPNLYLPINYATYNNRCTIAGVDYECLALPWITDVSSISSVPYRNAVMLVRLKTLGEATWDVVNRLALPGAIALVVSSLAALLVLRTITRPLHGMTLASERMALGDYDQQVAGADSSDEVGQLARSFNHMAYEVKRVREMQRQFIGNVSHDLRSPLTSIIGFSQALTEDDEITPSQRHLAEIIHGEAQRLSRLTLDLLDLSRLEAGRLPLNKYPLDLNEMLRDIAARYHALPNARGVRFSADLSAEPLPLLGDRDRLTQVMVNLLDNAFKFCNPGGEVRLTSARSGGVAVVVVRNSGAGIADDDLPRVFDRFYRADHSRAQQTGGSGIGLAIVRELVSAHGGEVRAASELGAWVEMTVRLPLDTARTFTKDLHLANSNATGLGV